MVINSTKARINDKDNGSRAPLPHSRRYKLTDSVRILILRIFSQ